MQAGIRSLLPGEASLIGNVVAKAFADDPVNLWAFNGTKAMPAAFTAMARHYYLRRGFGHVTGDGKSGTLWVPPGISKNYGVTGNVSLATAILMKGGLKALRRGIAIDNALMKKHPVQPHYYLFAIAVDPNAQGMGYGSQLMAQALRKIDADHKPAFLENSKAANIPFYERHGFRILEKIAPVPGCPPMWLMWRDAQ